MLHRLEFQNFKSWAEPCDLRFGRLTGLFGANSSGKSSIIHLLLLLKQTVESPDSTLVLNFGGSPSEYVDFGSFKDIVTDHEISKEITYRLSWAPDATSTEYRAASVENIDLSTDLKALRRRRGEEVVVNRLKYDINLAENASDSMRRYLAGLPSSFAVEASRGPRGGYTLELAISKEGEEQLFRSKQSLSVYGPIGLYRLSPRADREIFKLLRSKYNLDDFGMEGFALWTLRDAMTQVANYATQLLRRVVYLGPLRDYPHRNYAWTGAIPATVGHRGEEAIQVLLAGTSQKPSARRADGAFPRRSATPDVVTHWLRRLRIAESLSFEQVGRGARIWEARLHQQHGGAQNLTDVGFGMSQVLPVIVALLSAPRGSLVVLEHPEIHLHPRVQSDLADLLIDIANAGEIQILVESHSEHLLARIQRRIAEANRNGGGLTPEDVRLYFCELERGKSKLTPLEMQPSGVITNWPPDFFGDMLADRMALSGYYPEPEDLVADR